MSTYEDFYLRVRCNPGTSPLVMHPMSGLAGILWASLTEEMDGDWQTARHRIPLARDATDTIYLGSIAFREPGRSFRHPVVQSYTRTIARERDFCRNVAVNTTVKVNAGPYKNLLHWYDAHETPQIWFCGRGHLPEIERLLRRLTNIGSLRTKGFGRINIDPDDIEIGITDSLISSLFIDHGGLIEPIGPVPFTVCERYGVDTRAMLKQSAKFEPPYWLTQAQPCVVPRRTTLSRDQIKYALRVQS